MYVCVYVFVHRERGRQCASNHSQRTTFKGERRGSCVINWVTVRVVSLCTETQANHNHNQHHCHYVSSRRSPAPTPTSRCKDTHVLLCEWKLNRLWRLLALVRVKVQHILQPKKRRRVLCHTQTQERRKGKGETKHQRHKMVMERGVREKCDRFPQIEFHPLPPPPLFVFLFIIILLDLTLSMLASRSHAWGTAAPCLPCSGGGVAPSACHCMSTAKNALSGLLRRRTTNGVVLLRTLYWTVNLVMLERSACRPSHSR